MKDLYINMKYILLQNIMYDNFDKLNSSIYLLRKL